MSEKLPAKRKTKKEHPDAYVIIGFRTSMIADSKTIWFKKKYHWTLPHLPNSEQLAKYIRKHTAAKGRPIDLKKDMQLAPVFLIVGEPRQNPLCKKCNPPREPIIDNRKSIQ